MHIYNLFWTNTIQIHLVHWQWLRLIIFGNYCQQNVFDVLLQIVSESTWKILKLGWNFFIQKSRNYTSTEDMVTVMGTIV